MITGTVKLSCGNCGGKIFAMYCKGNHHNPEMFIAECTACKSTTVITTQPTRLQANFGENSDGILCPL